jgi:ribonuclease HI
MKRVIIYSDGASKGNPGEAGIGFVIQSVAGEIFAEVGEYIGKTTNNVAEYEALIRGLEAAAELGADEVTVRSDSQLLVMQLCGAYKVKSERLHPLHARACSLLSAFGRMKVEHVPREQNRRADELANQGVKRGRNKAARESLKKSSSQAVPPENIAETASVDGGQTTLGL